MRHLVTCGLCLLFTGCAGHNCCKRCGQVAGLVGITALVAVVSGAIDNAIDPEPGTKTRDDKIKHWEWEQRQMNSQTWDSN